MLKKTADLIEVRKIMALSAMALFAIMALQGKLETAFVQTVIISVVSFYFGKTTEASKRGGTL